MTEEPRFLDIFVTNNCNKSCRWCISAASQKKGTYISLDEVKRVLGTKKYQGALLTGGEPSRHPQFHDLVDVVSRLVFRYGIFTNASFAQLIYDKDGKINQKASIKSTCEWLPYLDDFTELTISVNSELLRQDPLHLERAYILSKAAQKAGCTLRYNLVGRTSEELEVVKEATARKLGGFGEIRTQHVRDPGFLGGLPDWDVMLPNGAIFSDYQEAMDQMRKLQ